MTTNTTDALASTYPTAPESGPRRLAQLVTRGLGSLLRALQHRRAVRDLLDMDERALRDMGVSRNDVIGALAQPVGVDPSIVLLVRSVEQRSRNRAFAPALRVLSSRTPARSDA